MNEHLKPVQRRNRVMGRKGLLELLGIAAARLTTVRRSAPTIPSRDHIAIDAEQHEVLRRLAFERQTSVNALVGTAIQDWIARQTKQPRRKSPPAEAPRRTSSRRKESSTKRTALDKPGAMAGSE